MGQWVDAQWVVSEWVAGKKVARESWRRVLGGFVTEVTRQTGISHSLEEVEGKAKVKGAPCSDNCKLPHASRRRHRNRCTTSGKCTGRLRTRAMRRAVAWEHFRADRKSYYKNYKQHTKTKQMIGKEKVITRMPRYQK